MFVGPHGLASSAVRALGSAQYESDEAIHEIGSELVVLDEETHVDGAVERIQKEVEISISGQFATADRAFQRGVSLAAARPKKAVAKGCDQVFIALASGENCGDDAAATTTKHLYQLSHLPGQIRVDRSGIREAQMMGCAAGEGIGDEGPFIRPPAVYRGFADLGPVGNLLDGEVSESALTQEF